MKRSHRLALAALLATLPALAACNISNPPAATAFQRNVGPGSAVGGFAQSDFGRNTPGDEEVLGVATGRATNGP